MPERVEDGGAVLSEEAQLEKQRLDEARASMEAVLENERKRRRNRWLFFASLVAGGLLLLPIVALYIALVIKLALSVA
jgi:hypothetical protein